MGLFHSSQDDIWRTSCEVINSDTSLLFTA
jgi:hypothetical protein